MHLVATTMPRRDKMNQVYCDNQYIVDCHLREFKRLRSNKLTEAICAYWLAQHYKYWQDTLQLAISQPTSSTVATLCNSYQDLKYEYDLFVKQKLKH